MSLVRLFCNTMGCSLPVSSVHGLFQAKIREWIAISYSKGASWPRDRTHISYISCIGRQILFHWCHLGSLEDPLLEFNKVYTMNLELKIILIPDTHTLISWTHTCFFHDFFSLQMYLHLHAKISFDVYLEGICHFVLYHTLLLSLVMTIGIKSLVAKWLYIEYKCTHQNLK